MGKSSREEIILVQETPLLMMEVCTREMHRSFSLARSSRWFLFGRIFGLVMGGMRVKRGDDGDEG